MIDRLGECDPLSLRKQETHFLNGEMDQMGSVIHGREGENGGRSRYIIKHIHDS